MNLLYRPVIFSHFEGVYLGGYSWILLLSGLSGVKGSTQCGGIRAPQHPAYWGYPSTPAPGSTLLPPFQSYTCRFPPGNDLFPVQTLKMLLPIPLAMEQHISLNRHKCCSPQICYTRGYWRNSGSQITFMLLPLLRWRCRFQRQNNLFLDNWQHRYNGISQKMILEHVDCQDPPPQLQY